MVVLDLIVMGRVKRTRSPRAAKVVFVIMMEDDLRGLASRLELVMLCMRKCEACIWVLT